MLRYREGKRFKKSGLFWAFFFVALLFRGPWAQEVNPTEICDYSGLAGRFTHSAFKSTARGWVFFNVYLPPCWSPEGSESYPLLFFLHGQYQDEWTFPFAVPAGQLNGWIEDEHIPPVVIVALRGSENRQAIQWYTPANEKMLTSESSGELRQYCRDRFRAGLNPEWISVQGFSRGASGTLHFAFNFPEKFASAVANAFVSDYVLEDRKKAAEDNLEEIINSGISLRLMVGSKDDYEELYGRQGTHLLHDFLEDLNIPHEYEVLEGITHNFHELWNFSRSDGIKTGLYELQFHARAWAKPGSTEHR